MKSKIKYQNVTKKFANQITFLTFVCIKYFLAFFIVIEMNKNWKLWTLIFCFMLGTSAQLFSGVSIIQDKKKLSAFDWEVADILPLDLLMKKAQQEQSMIDLVDLLELAEWMDIAVEEQNGQKNEGVE